MMSCVPNDGDWRGNFISRAEALEQSESGAAICAQAINRTRRSNRAH